MENKLRLAVLFLVFSAVLSLVVFFPQSIERLLVEPLLRLILFGLTAIVTPAQIVWWGLLVLVVLLIAGRALTGGEDRSPDQDKKADNEHMEAWFRPWLMTVQYAGSRVFSRDTARRYRTLVASVLAHKEHMRAEDLENSLKEGRRSLPGWLEEYLSDLENAGEVRRKGRLESFLGKIWGRIKKPAQNAPSPSQDGLEKMIDYLERELEIPYGDAEISPKDR
jgi:hypothetical protein